MKTFTAIRFLVLLVSALCLYACSESRKKLVYINPEFARYISGYTSGTISNGSRIRIELSQPVALSPGASLPDSNMLQKAFTFSPELPGKAVWVSDRVIEYLPAQPMTSNTVYEVEFDLYRVTKVDKSELEEFVFQYATLPLQSTLQVNSPESQHTDQPGQMKVQGELICSDLIDALDFRKSLRAVYNGKDWPVKWLDSTGLRQISRAFVIENLKRGEEVGELEILLEGDRFISKREDHVKRQIPALGDFQVRSVEVISGDMPSLRVFFTEPIKYQQDFQGLVEVPGAGDLRFSAGVEVVDVFFDKRLEGDYEVKVHPGILSRLEGKMKKGWESVIHVEAPKPALRLVGNGSVLPNSGGLIFPFEAISLKSVKVRVYKIFQDNVHQFLQVNELNGTDGLTRVSKVVADKTIALDYNRKTDLKSWNTHVIDLSKLIQPDPGAIYRVAIKFERGDAICDCPQEMTETDDNDEEYTEEGDDESVQPDLASFKPVRQWTDSAWNEWSWHGWGFEDGFYQWGAYYSENYTPCSKQFYYNASVSRNILASDIGIVYKLDEKRVGHAFVTNMITADPIANCRIEYYDYSKRVIASGYTNAEGMLELPLKEKPFLMVASYGRQKGYLKLLDANANSLSKFEVGGEVVQKGVKGFIYTERGVWRPGDSIYINFMLEDPQNQIPEKHPVRFELIDPAGKVVQQLVRTTSVQGLYDFRTSTSEESVTGSYLAVVRVGNRSFAERIRVETVKPNRLKIYFEERPLYNSASLQDTLGWLNARWLHGAPAKNLTATVGLSLSEMKTTFPAYPGFIFNSPVRKFEATEGTISNFSLNEEGKTLVLAALPEASTASGVLRANLTTKVFEESGDFSVDRFSTTYSPFPIYLGIRVPETKNWNNTLECNKAYRMEIAAVNPEGKSMKARKVNLRIYKIGWRWWYESGNEDLSSYTQSTGTLITKDSVFELNGKGSFVFHTGLDDYGRYLITLTDMENGHQTGTVVQTDWPYWSRQSEGVSDNASMLTFSLDKNTYRVGEKMKITIPTPASGRALISLESGSRIIRKYWIPVQKGETRFEIAATAEMSPNVYVHVTLLQPHAGTKNDLPIRMYGIQPVMVDDPSTHLEPLIACADTWKPESTVNITVKETRGKAMAYTLAIVDDGLLDLTRFRTPDPHPVFYAKAALGIRTWDIYDHVIGAFAGKIDKLLSIGGDGDLTGGKSVKANRFKPVVRHLGPFYLPAGAQKIHKVNLPNYVGSVRVMVVAGNQGAYGKAEKTIAVKKPLMLLATLPRVLGPGEEIAVPVTVFAMENNIKEVKLRIEGNEMLQTAGANNQNIRFNSPGDEVVYFKLKADKTLGVGKVKITAESGAHKAVYEVELDIRPSNPRVAETEDIVLSPGKQLDKTMVLKGIRGSNRVVFEISALPPINLDRRLNYLLQYPHGCVEQTTSAVFSQLYLNQLLNLNEKQKSRMMNNIKAGIKRLQLFQTTGGGLSYWPGENEASDWGSNYAGHFLMEAEKQGYVLPPGMKQRWIQYQKTEANNWQVNNVRYEHDYANESHQLIQAYRLYTLALAGAPETGAMNRMREFSGLTPAARWRLAAAYSLIGQEQAAANLINGLPATVKPYRELSYSYGSDFRDEVMMLEALSLLKRTPAAEKLMKRVCERLNENTWYSTQETGYALIALAQYGGRRGKTSEINAQLTHAGKAEHIASGKWMEQVVLEEEVIRKNATVSLVNKGNAPLYVKVINEGIPEVDDQRRSENGIGMRVAYRDKDGHNINVSRLTAGTDFYAEITLKNKSDIRLEEMTLNQIFPGGWEINNFRLDGVETNGFRYQDIRDDRVYTYYDLKRNEEKVIRVKLTATYPGKYYLPSVYTEAMYDQSIHALEPGQWIEVVPANPDIAKK